MRKKRWLADWADSETKPALYHILSRVVNREFRFKDEEREAFRMFMRMYENFSGCRVLSYCVMSNHFHILLEVPPMPKGGISDGELLKRLGVLNGETFVKGVADELAAARCEGGLVNGNEARVREIHGRFTKRMHSLSHFMQALQGVRETIRSPLTAGASLGRVGHAQEKMAGGLGGFGNQTGPVSYFI